MQTRSLVVAIALVLALAVAAPTIGATSNRGSVADRALDVAHQAREIAKTAKRAANKARGDARSALSVANTASTTATAASGKADAAGTKADAASATATGAATKADAVAAELNAAKAKSQTVNGAVTTANDAVYQDLGGPAVTVTVPASGLIEVWATVEAEEGAISLYEDGSQVPDLDPNLVCDGPNGALLSVPGSPSAVVSTPNSFPFGGLCGQPGPPTSVLLKTSPGQHTYSLRYADCGCDPADATFTGRSLTVAPRP